MRNKIGKKNNTQQMGYCRCLRLTCFPIFEFIRNISGCFFHLKICLSISVAELYGRRNSPTNWIQSTVMSKRSKVTLLGIDGSLMLSGRGREYRYQISTFRGVELVVVICFFGDVFYMVFARIES